MPDGHLTARASITYIWTELTDFLFLFQVKAVWLWSCSLSIMSFYRPRRDEMVLAIVLSTVLLGFIGLMGYMMYLTPGPTDRLE